MARSIYKWKNFKWFSWTAPSVQLFIPFLFSLVVFTLNYVNSINWALQRIGHLPPIHLLAFFKRTILCALNSIRINFVDGVNPPLLVLFLRLIGTFRTNAHFHRNRLLFLHLFFWHHTIAHQCQYPYKCQKNLIIFFLFISLILWMRCKLDGCFLRISQPNNCRQRSILMGFHLREYVWSDHRCTNQKLNLNLYLVLWNIAKSFQAHIIYLFFFYWNFTSHLWNRIQFCLFVRSLRLFFGSFVEIFQWNEHAHSLA